MAKASTKKKSGGSKSSAKRKTVSLSKISSKRKIARFGKKGKEGGGPAATSYISRSTAMKRLQVTLRDFRRLCILKGVYPREVGKLGKNFDSKQTYYSIKDVAALAHEPLLAKFREFKTMMRRVRKSVGRGEIEQGRRKHQGFESYTLHNIIKERYPRFSDALYDVDDALSTVCLFASLPAEGRVDADVIARCAALQTKWNDWVWKTGSLKKSFISVKGVYMQARVKNQDVVWLVPHRFSSSTPGKRDVDYRVMLTFLELYEVLVKFVLVKLYRDDAAEMAREKPQSPKGESKLFESLTFAFSREAKYPWLELVAKCAGAEVIISEDASAATHVVTDRPGGVPTLSTISDRCELVQPQWIVDSFNTGLRLPIKHYAPGADLPPHLSPFASEDDYVPAYREQLEQLKSAYKGITEQQQQEKGGDDSAPVVATSKTASGKRKATAQDPLAHSPSEEEDATKNLATIVMSKKAKRLHGRMLHGIKRKQMAVEKLRARRAKLDQERSSE